MPSHQKAIVIITEPGTSHGLDDLNLHLNRGWRIAQATPMGGAAVGATDGADVYFAALVILERADQASVDVLEAIAEESEEFIDDIIEGDGGIDLPDEDDLRTN